MGGLWAVLWYALLLLAFGVALPAMLVTVPRWVAATGWAEPRTCALPCDTIIGSMRVSFFGFQGAATADLLLKVIVDVLAFVGRVMLGQRVRARRRPSGGKPEGA